MIVAGIQTYERQYSLPRAASFSDQFFPPIFGENIIKIIKSGPCGVAQSTSHPHKKTRVRSPPGYKVLGKLSSAVEYK
jgi:hypothetical protein